MTGRDFAVMAVGLTFALFMGIFLGVQWQQRSECEQHLGGQMLGTVCVKGTEVIRRW